MSASDLEKRARQRIGQMFDGKWHLAQLLGVGGTAAVYAARHRNASTAAVKILHPTISHDDILRGRFLREGYVANTVGHPGAVRVLDDDTADDGSVYLVMELLEGETLDARARRKGGQLPVEDVLSICDQLLDVLAAAHDKGILHRDIKPENLFLTLDGQLKVLDFGIARLSDAASSATITGTALGTPAFMAPEMALGKADIVGPRTDLWAVGATMFNLLTGKYVQNGDSANEVLVRAATTRVVPIRVVSSSVPVEVADIVDRALAFEPDGRWQDAASFQEAVRHAYYALQGRPAGGPPPLPRMTAEELVLTTDSHPAIELIDAPDAPDSLSDEKTTLLAPSVPSVPSLPSSVSPPSLSERPPGTATYHSVTRTNGPPKVGQRGLLVGGAIAVGVVVVLAIALVSRGRSAPPSVAAPARSLPAVASSTTPSVPSARASDAEPSSVAALPAASVEKPAPTEREPKTDKDPKHKPPPRFAPPPLAKPDF